MEFFPRKFDSNRFDSPFGGETCSTVPRISFVVGLRPYPSGAARGCETRGEQRQKEREEARIFEADGDERKG